MCFGLVMLYSTSAYSANADFGNDMFYFSKQAIISAVSFAFMLFVSKLDYHVYGAFSWQIYYISLFLMLLVKTPLGVEAYGSRRWLQLSRQDDITAIRNCQNCSYFVNPL